MAHEIVEALKTAGVELPSAPAPAANYVPYTICGNLLYVSGQIAKDGDTLLQGKLGENTDIAAGQQAAKICAINLLAQVQAALDGDWSRFRRVIRLGGFVNSTPDFQDHPAVVNGASDFLVEILGDKGRHTRAAVGSSSLPFNVAVEIDGIFEIDN